MFDPFLFLYILVYVLIISIISFALLYFLKRSSFNLAVQKIIFIALGAFLAFPALMPAGTIAAIPMPNILFICLIAYFEGIDGFTDMFGWFIKTWKFNLIGLVIAAF